MAVIASQPNKIFEQDVAYGAAVSEAALTKVGSSINFIYDEFIRYYFGVQGGTYGSLVMPYTFSNSAERVTYNSEITQLEVTLGVCGDSGTTSFYLERQVNGTGPFATIFSLNCSIDNTATDGVFFTAIGGTPPSGVTLPTFNSLSLAANDRIRLVLTSGATNARNLSIVLKTRPV